MADYNIVTGSRTIQITNPLDAENPPLSVPQYTLYVTSLKTFPTPIISSPTLITVNKKQEQRFKLAMLVKSIPQQWLNCHGIVKLDVESTIQLFRMEVSFRQSKKNNVRIEKMPRIYINSPVSTFSKLVQEWIDVWTFKNSKKSDDEKDVLTPHPLNFLDPRSITDPMDNMNMSHDHQDEEILLTSGVYPLPTFRSPLLLLAFGKTHDFLSPSSMHELLVLMRIKHRAAYFSHFYGPETNKAFSDRYIAMRMQLSLWFKREFESFVKTHSNLLFLNNGTFIPIQYLLQKASIIKLKTFLTAFTMLMTEYARRWNNLIEMHCYAIFLGLDIWHDLAPEEMTNLSLVKVIDIKSPHQIRFPKFDSPLSTHINTMEQTYFETDKDGKNSVSPSNNTDSWMSLLTPNLATMIQHAKSNEYSIFDTMKKTNVVVSNKDNTVLLETQSCLVDIFHSIMSSGQLMVDMENNTSDTNKKTIDQRQKLKHDFRYLFVMHSIQMQQQYVWKLLEWIQKSVDISQQQRQHGEILLKEEEESKMTDDKPTIIHTIKKAMSNLWTNDKTLSVTLKDIQEVLSKQGFITQLYANIIQRPTNVSLESIDSSVMRSLGIMNWNQKDSASAPTPVVVSLPSHLESNQYLRVSSLSQIHSIVQPLYALIYTQLICLVHFGIDSPKEKIN